MYSYFLVEKYVITLLKIREYLHYKKTFNIYNLYYNIVIMLCYEIMLWYIAYF